MASAIALIPGFIRMQTPKSLTWMKVQDIKLVFVKNICKKKLQTHMTELSTAYFQSAVICHIPSPCNSCVVEWETVYLYFSFEMLKILLFSASLHAFMNLLIPCVEKHLSFFCTESVVPEITFQRRKRQEAEHWWWWLRIP